MMKKDHTQLIVAKYFYYYIFFSLLLLFVEPYRNTDSRPIKWMKGH